MFYHYLLLFSENINLCHMFVMDFQLASYAIKRLQRLCPFIFVIKVSFVIKTTGNYLALTSVILKTLTLTTFATIHSQDLCLVCDPEKCFRSCFTDLSVKWWTNAKFFVQYCHWRFYNFAISDLWKLHLGFRIVFEQNHNFNATSLNLS